MSSLLGLEEEKNGPTSEQDLDRDALEAQMKSGASWFYWIAALSVINSVIYLSGSEWSFLAGLGLTQLGEAFVDIAIENGAPSALKAVAIVFNFMLVAVFALFGYYASTGSTTAFVVGIVLYTLDGLLLLLLGVFLSAGFHAFALFFIVRGFLACRTLKAHRPAEPVQMPPPPPPAPVAT